MKNELRPETIAAQAGGRIDAETGAIVAPVHISSTFERDPDNEYRRGYAYARPDNATVRQVEDVLTALERADHSLVVGSGMSAAILCFLALEKPAHVVAPEVMYWGLKNWLRNEGPGVGIEATFVDASDPAAVARALQPGKTKLVWIETPANPLWLISDIAVLASVAHDAGARLGVDSTIATPVLSNPLSLGADVVMHSATKYLGGHSDLIAGALCFARRDAYADKVAALRGALGMILGPFEAALLMRGMRTLHLRVKQQSASALAIAQHFAKHDRIDEVLYPGLAASPGHEVARAQMSGGFGGMLSIRVKGGERAAIRAAARLKVWKRATSLGGVESLVEHRASVEGPGTPCPPDLLRLSVGIEAVEDLISDLEQALAN